MLIGQKFTVVGAGVAGLAVARALAMRGASVAVHERAETLGEAGGGLQIAPNGMAVLDALGLGAEARAASVKATGVELVDGLSGRRVTRLDLERHGRGQDWQLFHRADLVALLAQGAEAAGVRIELGQAVEAAGLSGMVLAADGFGSELRQSLNGPSEPFFTGQVAWRTQIPWTGPETRDVRVFLGPGCHIVTYPLRGGTLRNIVAVEERAEWAEEGWSHPDDPAHLQDAFAGFDVSVREMLAQVQDVRLWGLFRHPIANRWHDDRRAILGDAAHPTLPFLAQGANMALEDAWVLAASLAETPPPEAFARYHALRAPRVARAIAAANANARNYHLRGLTRYAAHKVLRIGGLVWSAGALRRFDWLYRHDVTQ